MSLTLTCAHESHAIAEEPDARVCSQAACSRREPQSPLIQDLLKRIKVLPSLDGLEDPDLEAEAELKGSPLP